MQSQESGYFDREIVPVTLPDGTVVAKDDGPRASSTLEKLAQLDPAFREDGKVTAGNSCPLNDGAAAVLVMSDTKANELGLDPRARIIASATAANEPEYMGVAVDDFGTGYSSLAYLSRLPVDTMKIPKQFIDEVTGSREHHALARAVIELGSALDLKVVAEGIETPEQIAALRAFGCDLGQGYFYGLPTDADVALRRVELLRSDIGRPALRAV